MGTEMTATPIKPRDMRGWQWVRDEVTRDSTLTVGVRIKTIRVAMRLTQRQLAERIGAGSTSLARWEIGHSEPWPLYLYRIAQTFGCSMDELYAAGASWRPYPIQPHRSDSVPCKGVGYRGRPCGRWTRNTAGRCPWHIEEGSWNSSSVPIVRTGSVA